MRPPAAESLRKHLRRHRYVRAKSMDKFDRIFDLHRYFSARRTPATIDDIAGRLECNRSTAYRLLGVLRDQLDAPIEKDLETGGFIYRADAGAPRYELPGLWFSAAELQAPFSSVYCTRSSPACSMRTSLRWQRASTNC